MDGLLLVYYQWIIYVIQFGITCVLLAYYLWVTSIVLNLEPFRRLGHFDGGITRQLWDATCIAIGYNDRSLGVRSDPKGDLQAEDKRSATGKELGSAFAES